MRTSVRQNPVVTAWENNLGWQDAFGMVMPDRNWNGKSYRFGFNNQELDSEFGPDIYSFEYRVHDARLGRFLSVDPLYKDYMWQSCYTFAENNPIWLLEIEGLEAEEGNYGYSWSEIIQGTSEEKVAATAIERTAEYCGEAIRQKRTAYLNNLKSQGYLKDSNGKLHQTSRLKKYNITDANGQLVRDVEGNLVKGQAGVNFGFRDKEGNLVTTKTGLELETSRSSLMNFGANLLDGVGLLFQAIDFARGIYYNNPFAISPLESVGNEEFGKLQSDLDELMENSFDSKILSGYTAAKNELLANNYLSQKYDVVSVSEDVFNKVSSGSINTYSGLIQGMASSPSGGSSTQYQLIIHKNTENLYIRAAFKAEDK